MIGNRCRASEYCCEDISLIENYNDAMNSEEEYDCHHRLETHDENGNLRDTFITSKELKKLGKYYNVKAAELIFIPRHEHLSMHSKNLWERKEHKEKMSERKKGEKNPFYGKTHSEEALEKMRSTKEKNGTLHKGTFDGQHHSDETKKIISEKKKGRSWFNNGEINVMRFECPEGFVPGRLKMK